MKKQILLVLVILLLSSCSTTVDRGSEKPDQDIDTHQTESTPEPSPIPPFESDEQEVLSLPIPQGDFADMNELIDSIIADYEVVHITDFKRGFIFEGIEIENVDDGFVFKAVKPINSVSFEKPLSEYFTTKDNSYGVLIRFNTDNAENLNFDFNSKFGRIMLDFSDGIYPATDVAGDSYGDAMYKDDWNNYSYTVGTRAYAFLTINNVGQKNCYIWAEEDPDNYNFVTSYGEDTGGDWV